MTVYRTNDTDLKKVADAIRTKGGTSANLTYPDGYVTAIQNIQTGTDTSDATLNSSGQMLSGVTAYSRGTKYTGNIASKSSSDLTASGATVTVPAGHYASQATKSVTSGSATAPSSISGTSSTVSVSNNTVTLSKTVSVTPSVTAGYISSGTATNSSVSLSGSMTTQAAQTLYPSSSDQTISSGRYLSGAQTFKGVTVANLTAANIKQGVTVTVGDSSDADRIMSVTGTYSGGGGSGIGTLLATKTIGTVSTNSTTATNLNQDISVSGINNYDLLIVEASVDSVTNGRHCATISPIFLTAGTTIGTKNGGTVCSNKMNIKVSSNGTYTSVQGTTAYGIYANSITISNGSATIPMYRRYNSTSTGTINGSYTARVYGVNLYDLIGG